MKKNKLSESKIFSMLNEVEEGSTVESACRKYNIASSTYYKLKSKYAGMSIPEMKRLRELEIENSRLKSMYADISLEHKILKDILEKKYPELLEDN